MPRSRSLIRSASAAFANIDKARFQKSKWITSIEVANRYPADIGRQGFNWFSGI